MIKPCPGFLFDKGMFLQKRTPFIVITLSGLAGPLMAAVTTFADLEMGLIFSGLLLIILATITYFVFPKVVFCVILAMMLMNVSSPQLASALGYFYTADEQCLKDGEFCAMLETLCSFPRKSRQRHLFLFVPIHSFLLCISRATLQLHLLHHHYRNSWFCR